MQVNDFDYDLPDKLIAQEPIPKRDESRLMLLDRKKGSIEETVFKNIVQYLDPGDLLVLNDSKVIPARLYGKKIPTGTEIEVLLLNEKKEGTWEVLVKPGRRVKKGVRVSFGEGLMEGKAVEYTDFGGRIMEFDYRGEFEEVLQQLGEMPLPPYIKKDLEEPERYQTVYAQKKGSAAAPTAGLHFTPQLLQQIKNKGVNVSTITLHVGLGTFRPVREEKVEEHDMHAEYYEIDNRTAQLIKKTKQDNKRVIAVGTTVTRTLEGVYDKHGSIKVDRGWTDIFIYPGFDFQVLDGLITNFHLPKSTLLMLVSAFAGKKNVMHAYQKAIEKEFRFYSLGDAMFIS
ncbi:MAG: tRNA preQ1(34) S-adenosylmethionine ribosyltransferase-isomerase QueA [Bacillota bacterium]